MGRLIVEQIVSVDGYAADARRRHRILRGRRRGRLERRRPARVPRARRRDPARREHLPDVRRLLADGRPRGRARGRADQPPAEVRRVEHPRLGAVGRRRDRDPPRRRRPRRSPRSRSASTAIVVWGSLTLADALFEAGLVDELRLRVVPVLIGEGRSFTPRRSSESGGSSARPRGDAPERARRHGVPRAPAAIGRQKKKRGELRRPATAGSGSP